jgi:hypothetical protein
MNLLYIGQCAWSQLINFSAYKQVLINVLSSFSRDINSKIWCAASKCFLSGACITKRLVCWDNAKFQRRAGCIIEPVGRQAEGPSRIGTSVAARCAMWQVFSWQFVNRSACEQQNGRGSCAPASFFSCAEKRWRKLTRARRRRVAVVEQVVPPYCSSVKKRIKTLEWAEVLLGRFQFYPDKRLIADVHFDGRL